MIRDIWAMDPGQYRCIARRQGDHFSHSYLREHDLAALRELLEHDNDAYFCLNPCLDKSRRKDDMSRGHWLGADLDEVDPRGLDLKPTKAIETSSGRYQAFWYCSEVVTDEMAVGLVRFVSADEDSHAINKLFRVPGSRNHKYSDKPVVRLLWDNGPEYTKVELCKSLPKCPVSVADEVEIDWAKAGRLDGMRLARKYGVWMRMVEVPEGRRSGMIYAITSKLTEKGASFEEIAAVVMASGSYRSRFEEKHQEGKQDIERVIGKLKS